MRTPSAPSSARGRTIRSLLLLATLAASGAALAQPAEAPVEVRYKKSHLIDFTAVSIDGAATKPYGAHLRAKPQVRLRNLIEMRSSFRPELRRTSSRL